MASEMLSVGGFYPAIVTPCGSDGTLDVPSLRRLVTHMFAQEVDGLYVGGNTGEGYLLSVAERKMLAEVCAAEGAKVGKCVVVHVGHPRTATALDLAVHAKASGATAISSMPPFVGGVRFETVHAFYTKLAAAAAPLPVVAYHIPSVTKSQMTTAELCRLLEIDGVVGFKYTDGDLYKLERTMAARPDALIFHGMSTVQAASALFGACGGITGGGGNLTPRLMSQLVRAARAGDLGDAMRMQRIFNGVQASLYGPFAPKMVATFKAILVWQGVIATAHMVQDAALTPDEITALREAVIALPELKATLVSPDTPLYP